MGGKEPPVFGKDRKSQLLYIIPRSGSHSGVSAKSVSPHSGSSLGKRDTDSKEPVYTAQFSETAIENTTHFLHKMTRVTFFSAAIDCFTQKVYTFFKRYRLPSRARRL